jgi:hypothetical protein
MNARKNLMSLTLLMVLILVVTACAPAAMPATPAPAATMSAAAAPTAPAANEAASNASANLPNVAPRSSIRMIIKNGEMTLLVADTDRALDQATGIAVNSGGYVVSSKTWNRGEFKSAALTMGVPSDQFEAVQRQLRALAVEVLSDTSSGQDVSDEFVDLQSRLTNLEATAARIRELLKDAKDVDEALQVNIKLSEVESEIEQIKGRMQYLKDRSAFSTIVLNLQPDVPTPTPAAWQPGKTIESAANSAGNLVRGLIDGTIWLVVALGPVLIPLALVVWLIVRAQRKRAKRGPASTTTPSDK